MGNVHPWNVDNKDRSVTFPRRWTLTNRGDVGDPPDWAGLAKRFLGVRSARVVARPAGLM